MTSSAWVRDADSGEILSCGPVTTETKTFFEPHYFLTLQKPFSEKDRGGGGMSPQPSDFYGSVILRHISMILDLIWNDLNI